MLMAALTLAIVGISANANAQNTSETLLEQTHRVANEILAGAGLKNQQTGYTDNSAAVGKIHSDIVLLSQKLKKCGFGYRDLVGQVQNIGNATATSVQVSYTTFDSAGGVLGTDYAYIDADTLNPGQKSTFKIMASCDDFKGMKNYELSLEWTDSNSEQMYVENAQVHSGVRGY